MVNQRGEGISSGQKKWKMHCIFPSPRKSCNLSHHKKTNMTNILFLERRNQVVLIKPNGSSSEIQKAVLQ